MSSLPGTLRSDNICKAQGLNGGGCLPGWGRGVLELARLPHVAALSDRKLLRSQKWGGPAISTVFLQEIVRFILALQSHGKNMSEVYFMI